MKSITRIRKRVARKKHPVVVALLLEARKHKAWHEFAHKLSGPTKNFVEINLNGLNKFKEGDSVIVIGKVLSTGVLAKKMRVGALGLSSSAKTKIKESKTEIFSIMEEIKKNPKAEGVTFVS